jgi:hypothetical protein
MRRYAALRFFMRTLLPRYDLCIAVLENFKANTFVSFVLAQFEEGIIYEKGSARRIPAQSAFKVHCMKTLAGAYWIIRALKRMWARKFKSSRRKPGHLFVRVLLYPKSAIGPINNHRIYSLSNPHLCVVIGPNRFGHFLIVGQN